jgi:DNA-binding NtrC family response regulator
MGLLMEIPTSLREGELLVGLSLGKRRMSRVLIVSEICSEADQLKAVFQAAGIASESAGNMTAACESVKTGRFGVVFSTPQSGDGSWTRLIEVASQGGLSFEIVLFARTYDLDEWAEALQLGAFEVLDVLRDLPKAGEVARRALGSAHLKRFRPGC